MSLTSYPRVLRRILALLTAVVLVSWGTAMLSPADAESGPKECTEGTGWQEISVNDTTFTYTAPEGQVITEVCAKGPDAFEPVFFSAGGVDSFSFDAADYGWVNQNGEVQQISHIGVKLADAPDECPDGDHNGAEDGCGTPPEECPDGDHNGTEDGCGTPPEECPDGDHNGTEDGCGTPPEECPDGDHNGTEDGCGTPPEECPDGDHNGTEDGCGEPDEGDGDVCEEGTNAGLPIPPGETEESFCNAPGGDNPGGDNPGGDNPGGDNPGGDNPGGNTPGGNDASDTEVLGAQASIGAGAPSGAGSSAPSAGAAQVPTAVNAGIEGPDATSTGLPSALALLMVGFGLLAFGMAIAPSRRTGPRHRQS